MLSPDLVCMCFVVFFKQKTAYDMRISDWSSDVCSSDLVKKMRRRIHNRESARRSRQDKRDHTDQLEQQIRVLTDQLDEMKIEVASLQAYRKRDVYGKSVSVRVDFGGSVIFKKKIERNDVACII